MHINTFNSIQKYPIKFHIFCGLFYFPFVVLALFFFTLIHSDNSYRFSSFQVHFFLISSLTFSHQFVSLLLEKDYTNEYVLSVTHTWTHEILHTYTHIHMHDLLSNSRIIVILGSRSKAICQHCSLSVSTSICHFLCRCKHRYNAFFVITMWLFVSCWK